MREEERKELCGEMRESTDVAGPRGPPKGLSKERIFSISVEECVLQVTREIVRKKVNRRCCFGD